MIERFVDNDTDYMNWVSSNPLGYVVNCESNPRPAYLILHRANCRTINELPFRGRVWTSDYIKVCSIDRRELDIWAMREVGGELRPCGFCNPI